MGGGVEDGGGETLGHPTGWKSGVVKVESPAPVEVFMYDPGETF